MNTLDYSIKKIIENYNKVYGYNLTKEEVFSKKRNQPIVQLRHIIYYYMRQRGMTLTEIGKIFGKTHATIMHGVENVEFFDKNYKDYKQKLQKIMKIEIKQEEVKMLFAIKQRLNRLIKETDEMIEMFQKECTHKHPDGSSAIRGTALGSPYDVDRCEICGKEF